MHYHLLQQAKGLAGTDQRGAPRQANLRRAVSSAYYALFHYLIDESCRAVIGTQHAQQGYRYVVARAFSHATMKAACSSYSATQLPDVIVKPLPKNVAGEFRFAGRARVKKNEVAMALAPTSKIEQIALLGFASNKNISTVGGGRVMLIRELLAEIFKKRQSTSLATSAVSEQFGLLRTLQIVSDNRKFLHEFL